MSHHESMFRLVPGAMCALLLAALSAAGGQQPVVAARQQPRAVMRGLAVARVDVADSIPSVRFVRRPPLKFVPFDSNAVDQRTGKPLNMNDTVLLPTGRKMTRREYFEQANRLERQLNASGYTLHAKNTPLRFSLAPPSAAQVATQRARLVAASHGPLVMPSMATRQARLRATPMLSSATRPMLDSLSPATVTAIKKAMALLVAPSASAGALTLPLEKDFQDAHEFGDRGHLAARFDYSAKVIGDTTSAKLNAAAGADVWIFGKHGDIASIDVNGVAPKSGAPSGTVDVNVLGKRVFDYTLSSSEHSFEKYYSEDVDYSAKAYFYVGIPISVRVGGRGTIGVSLGLAAQNAAVTADITPSIDLAGYAEAGADLWLVSVGVGAQLTLLDLRIPVDGRIALLNNPEEGVFGLDRELTVGYSISALAGRVYLYGDVFSPCWPDFWNDCSDPWTYDIFNWSGVKSSGQLVSLHDYVDFLSGTTTAFGKIRPHVSGHADWSAPSALTFTATDSVTGKPINAIVKLSATDSVSTGVPVTRQFCSLRPVNVFTLSLMDRALIRDTTKFVNKNGKYYRIQCGSATYHKSQYLSKTVSLAKTPIQ